MDTTHRQTSPEETRERILAAAREVYVRNNGRHGTTTREIAQLAGVNEVTLFRHFGSKERLLAEMVGRCTVKDELGSVIHDTGDLRADLIRIGLALARAMERVEDIIRVHLTETTVGGADVFEGPRRGHQAIVDFMQRQADLGRIAGDPRRLTRTFSGMIFAHVMGKRFWEDDGPITESDVARYTDIFLKGTQIHG